MNPLSDDSSVYIEPPTIPAGVTIGEYRRARTSRAPHGLLNALLALRSRR